MSCLKHFDFTEFTKDEIISKYEEVLEGRENQVTDLSLELGKTQEKLESFEERIKLLEEENAKIQALLKKKDFFLNEELKSKEIIFMRLQDKENECDQLKVKLQQYIKPEKHSQGKVGALVGYLFGSSSSASASKDDKNLQSNVVSQNIPFAQPTSAIQNIQSNQINPEENKENEIKGENVKKEEDIISKSTKSLDRLKQIKDKKKKKNDEEEIK